MTYSAKLMFFVLALITLVSCGPTESVKTPEMLRFELQAQEEVFPLQYLEAQEVILKPQRKQVKPKGLLRDAEYVADGVIIEGFINNKATIARYKDVHYEVRYYSKTKTLIQTDSYVFYEYYLPQVRKKFSIHVDCPDIYEHFDFKIVGATAATE